MSLLKGKHSVKAALMSQSGLERIVVDHAVKNRRDIQDILDLARRKGVKVQFQPRQRFRELTDEDQTQGVIGYQAQKQHMSLDHILANQDAYPFLVLLDHIQDPYNFGAILRTCDVMGVSAVIYPKDRNVQITPGVIKASSGAVEYLDMIKVTNLNQTVRKLQDAGYWVYGADSNEGRDLSEMTDVSTPLALVVGNEAKGISHSLQKHLDFKIRIPQKGQVESLNVSVATGIILHGLSSRL